jgi:hypothetical protein
MELTGAVIEWWEKHRYDTTWEYGEEWSVYDEAPKFVRIAKRFRDKYPIA